MSFIDTSIKLLKSLIKPNKVASNEVSSMLESIHGSLLAMSQKESELLSKQTTVQQPAHEASPEILPEPSPKMEDVAAKQPIMNGNAETLEQKPIDQPDVSQKTSLQADKEEAVHLDTGADTQPTTAPLPRVKRKYSRKASSVKPSTEKTVKENNSSSESSESLAESHVNSTGITDDTVTCLICGKILKRLSVHIKKEHDISESAYRRRFKIPESVPLIAPALSRKYGERTKARYAAARLAKEEQKSENNEINEANSATA